MPALREIVREFRDHCYLMRRCAMLTKPAYTEGESDIVDYMNEATGMTEMYADEANDWMTELTSYPAIRYEKLRNVRTSLTITSAYTYFSLRFP